MTFIASVVARDGVAVIADSLVTTSEPILEFGTLLSYLNNKSSTKKKSGETTIKTEELVRLFKSRPSYTKNYEDKLIQYDKYTAITTSGGAIINDKKISIIINKISERLTKKRWHNNKTTARIVQEFCDALALYIKSHLKKYKHIDRTVFILTRFYKRRHQVEIYRIVINPQVGYTAKNITSCSIVSKNERVICEGQNRTAERLIYGELILFNEIAQALIQKFSKDLGVDITKIPSDYIQKLLDDKEIMGILLKDVKANRLTDLSLQQAVNLASLLMQIEIDMQEYTENLPTVGGLIKLAVINEQGFKYISGGNINKPKSLL